MSSFWSYRRAMPAAPGQTKAIWYATLSALTLIFAIGLTAFVSIDYRRTEGEATKHLSYLADVFDRSIEASLSIANVRMGHAIDQVAQLPLTTQTWADETYEKILTDTIAEIEQIDALVLIAPTGEVVWASAEGLLGKNLADRKYFNEAIKLTRGQYTIGIPILSRGDGRRITPIAWPVLSSTGVNQGVIASSLGEAYFEGLLSTLGLQSDIVVEMITSDGAVAFSTSGAAGRPSGERIAVAKQSPELDVTVTVSQPRAAVFEGFRDRTLIFLGTAIALFACALGLAIGSQRKSRRLADTLRQSTADNIKITTAQREFNTIFQNVGDGIVIFDDKNTVLQSNKMARRFLNAKSDIEATAQLRALLPPLSQLQDDFTAFKLDMPHSRSPKDKVTIQARVMKLQHGAIRAVYCVLTDISAEERLYAAREHFITSVNHELRTPLTSLAGALEVLEDRFSASLAPAGRKLVAMATRNADRLLLLVNDILTLQAIDQGKLQINLEPVPVHQALHEAVETNVGYGLGTSVRLALELPACDAVVTADKVRLQQVFSNFISNAVKYSPAGGVVTIGATLDDGEVAFWVRDHGPGIPQSSWAYLFERFSQPVHAKGTQATGTGLGLAITKELIERQGGAVSLRSKTLASGSADHGTTFVVKFAAQSILAEEKEMAC